MFSILSHAVQIIGEGGIETSSQVPVKSLVVSVVSKQVRLPENEATLSAYTVPAEQPGKLVTKISSFSIFVIIYVQFCKLY